MDDMDIDQVVEIPNTPDRPAARHINAGDFVGKHNKLSVAGRLKNSDFIDEECLNQPRAQGRPVNENGHNRRFHIHPLSNSGNIDKVEQSSNSIAFSPLENPHASCNASIFRRTTIDKNSKHDTRNPFGAHHMDKGKVTCSKFPSKSSSFQEGLASLDLPIQNGCGKMKDLPAKVIQEVQIAANGSSSHWPPIFPKMSGNSSKGKEKIGEDSIMGREKGINLSSGSHHNNESQVSASHHSVVSPRIGRQRRLVQNGCISPHNIEIRAKQLAEHSENCSKDAEKDHSVDVVHSGPRTIDIRHVVAEDNDRCRSKGIRIHSCTLNERDPEVIHLSSSSTTKHGETNGNGHASGDAFRCTEGLGGCRSTHNHSKKVDHSLPDSTGPYSRRNDGIGCVLELDQISESRHVANAFSKRQKKHESTSRNHRESSRTLSDDSEIVFLSSSAESSRSRASRIQRHQHQRILDVDELTPEVRHSGSQGIDCSNDDDSDARARQLEADEQLAVELQEQLYHESAVFGGDEIDENVAWVLQQEEDALRFSNHNHHMLHPRTSSTSYRQPQSWLLQSASHRRGTRAEVHNSTRVTQLRNRLLNRSRAAPSRARNFQFPLNMDLDMRLDILETLEAAVGDLTDMEPVSHISQLQRDFNENDYEMLLALDENNCQRGASTNQINSLPLSIVQTDDYEACAICLDTPTIGESIRHLPCMHKFHKACIDPWLSRSTSCPVCKSSIT